MLKIKNFLGCRVKSSFTRNGKSQTIKESNLTSKLSVNEEYKKAFRTKSYLEIRTKAEDQLERTFCDRLSSSPPPSSSSSSSSSSVLSFQIHFTDYLLEPRQETLDDLMRESSFHRLLVRFFDSSSEACDICESLLKCIQQTRVNHRKIKRVIKVGKRVCNGDNCSERVCSMVFQELSRFALLKNPLCIINEAQFLRLHASNSDLLKRLTSKRRRIRRKVKFFRFCKKFGGYGLVISHSALLIALMIVALHGILGIFAAPTLLGLCSLGLLRKKMKGNISKTDLSEKLGTQLDVAAKGVFIMINDFDTTCRLAGRLYDEIEHRKSFAAMCAKSQKSEVLKEVVREFHGHDQRFVEQLHELEEHVYLCFHTINRSRRQVWEQITGPQTSQ